jgi:hypothetical protein
MYEGRPMTECGVPMNKLIEYMQRPGKILCHCHAGGTRAPSLAIFAKAARGCDPQKAIGEVIAALQYQYADAEVCATFNIKPLCEVFQRWPRKVEVAHV